ncbi:MAG: 23S rRNA (adenine(2503)-C(2))-methyltransferase RlmN [Rhodobiaceae bacterium]|nr:MAG: 23S rRNA (adenine(2503)-C(2))-methyltransferase RlmN [Rhodobiaceae bacterium]
MATVLDRTDQPATRARDAVSPSPADTRLSLIGLNREELAAALHDAGVREKQIRMRVGQVWNAIYHRGHTSFDDVTTLAKDCRADFAKRFSLERPKIVTEQVSSDGTRKWLIRLPSNNPRAPSLEVEAVYIPEANRGTLCISSQVGCTLNCTFCHTGTQKLVHNLTSGEIIAQILIARDTLGEWPIGPSASKSRPAPQENRLITNIVLMGMGEPLYNFDNVKQAMAIASDGDGLSVSKRRITLSTSGVVPEIARVGDEIGVMLAISLHAVNNPTRDLLVPINKKYPLEELLDACRNFPGVSNARRITFEYVMLKGVNDSLKDAKDLVRLLKGIPAKINLIPFNAWPGAPYECSDWEQIEKFAEIINRAGYASPIRTPRGRDIMAACGQLKSASEKIRASQVAS